MRLASVMLAAVAVLAALLLWFHFASQPPKESATIANFYKHRAEYDELRAMLLSDKELVRVADWGIQTSDSLVEHTPTEGNFSVDRYHKYLALLHEIGAKGAFRSHEEHPEIGVQIWVSGFGGDTRHVNVCWREDQPTNQVSSLDEFYRTSKPRKAAYRHIDGDWYIWVDW